MNNVHNAVRQRVPVPAIERAVRVLQALGGKGDGLGLSEFSRLVGISKSTLSNILVSLEKLGLVERDPQSLTYRLGVGLLELTQPVLGKLDLRQLAHAHLVKLRDSTGETAILHVPSGENAVVVDRAEPDRQLKVVAPLGLRLPRFAGSVSKVFLAALPVQEAETLVRRSRLPAFTPRSVTEPDRFLRELAEVRRTGFASDDEEYLPGVRAVSASIRGAGGRAVGAISIAGVRGHLGNVRMKELAGAVVAAAEQVSRVNGVGVNFPSATETYGN